MAALALEVQKRDHSQSADSVRAKGLVPAVFYGPKEASTAISIDAKKLEHVWKEAGQTSVVTLKGAGADHDTLIHDVQLHPVSGRPLHVDFYVLEKGKKVEIKVPLEFVGTAPAEKAGHILVKALHEIEIEVAPADLPHHLLVDLSHLENVGDHIVASDIQLPASATLITNAEEIIASVTAFVEEKIEAPAPAEAAPSAEGEAAQAEAATLQETQKADQ